jgi:hypothetical protein
MRALYLDLLAAMALAPAAGAAGVGGGASGASLSGIPLRGGGLGVLAAALLAVREARADVAAARVRGFDMAPPSAPGLEHACVHCGCASLTRLRASTGVGGYRLKAGRSHIGPSAAACQQVLARFRPAASTP